MNIQQEVTTILEEMGINKKAITANANFYKDLGLDSLDMTELIMTFEYRFKVEIPMDKAEEIYTVKQAIDYLRGSGIPA